MGSWTVQWAPGPNSLKLARTLILKFILNMKWMIENGAVAKRELKEKWLELELEQLRVGRGREMHLNPHWAAFVRVFFRGAKKFHMPFTLILHATVNLPQDR